MTVCMIHHQKPDSVDGFLFAPNINEMLQKLRMLRVVHSLAGVDVNDVDNAIDELNWRVERNITPEPGMHPIGDYTLLVEG